MKNLENSTNKEKFLSTCMNKHMVLKLIGTIYSEHLSHYQLNLKDFNSAYKLKESLMEYTFGHMHYQYGIEEIAKRKLNKFIKGLIRYSDHPRISLFYSFLNPSKSETGSVELYLKAIHFLTLYLFDYIYIYM